MEIDENLARAELSPAERAAHIYRRAELWEKKRKVQKEESNGQNLADTLKVSKRGRVGEGRPKQFAAETAAIAKTSKSAVNQDISRAEKLGPDLSKIAGTSLDKGVEIDALIKLPEPKRASLIERAAAGGGAMATFAANHWPLWSGR